MGKEVTFDYSKAAGFVSAEEMENFKTTVLAAKDTLLAKTGAGNDFLEMCIRDRPDSGDQRGRRMPEEGGCRGAGRRA